MSMDTQILLKDEPQGADFYVLHNLECLLCRCDARCLIEINPASSSHHVCYFPVYSMSQLPVPCFFFYYY